MARVQGDPQARLDEIVSGLTSRLSAVERGVRHAMGRTTSAPAVTVDAYGADPTGSTDSSAALQAAYDAIASTGGSLAFGPGGVYKGGFVMDSTKPVQVLGYGATLKVPVDAIGIDVQAGNGMADHKGVVIEGLLIQGEDGVEFDTGNTGIRVENSDWVKIRNLKAQFLDKGIHFLSSGDGWVEAASVEQAAIYGCSTGIRFEQAAGATSGSFAETALRDVGINDCTIAIDTSGNNGTGLERSSWDNVTIWLARAGQVGVKIGANLHGAAWKVAFETTVAATAFQVRANATSPETADIEVDWNISGGATQVDVDAGLQFFYRVGGTRYQALGSGAGDASALLGVANDGDTTPRAYLAAGSTPGVNLGGGSGAIDIALQRGAAGRLDVFADVMHRGSKFSFFGALPGTKPTITGSRGGNAALASLLTELDTLGLIDDATTA